MGYKTEQQLLLHRDACRRYRKKNPNKSKEYYEKNKETILEKQHLYSKTHREQQNKTHRIWSEKNRERSREIKRKYYPKSNERRRLLRKSSESYRETIRKQKRKSYQKHRQSYIIRAKKWVKDNPEQVLKVKVKHHAKCAQPFNISVPQYKWALHSWAKTIKQKQNHQCQICGNTADEVHHIFYKSFYPELSLNINNGISLCVSHHYEVHGKAM